MKVNSLNKIELVISGHTNNLNDRYFNEINVTVGLFLSAKYKYIEWCEDNRVKRTPVVLIPKDEFNLQKKVFSELNELESYFEKHVEMIIWFGKSTLQKEKYNSDRVVAHELRRVEQRNRNINTVYKDRVLSFILHEEKLPTEIDANNFVNMTVARNYNKNYDWVKEAQKLYKKNLQKIKLVDRAITEMEENIIVGNEFFFELSQDQNKRELFQYYFNKIKS